MVKTSVRGVVYDPKNKTKPYFFQIQKHGIRKNYRFSTLQAAADAKRAFASNKDQAAKAAKAERVQVKQSEAYRRNQATYGNSCKQERDFLLKAQACAPESFLVMNDGTRADALVERAKDAYLQVQAKTTATTMKGRKSYRFCQVLGYAGMLVVFWVVDKQRAWVFDGTWLHDNGKEKYFLTPGHKSERPSLQKNLTLTELVAYLHDADLAPHLRLTTETAARRDFKCEDHKKEKLGIEGYEELKPGTYLWPRAQNGVYDRVRVEGARRTRIQHKSCGPNGQQAGLFCGTLGKCDGSDAGKQLHTCYAPDDADEYVFHYDDETASHYWKIPAQALADHGYFTKTTGKESIYLYGPVGKQPNPNAIKPADTWTRAYFIGSVTRKGGDVGDGQKMASESKSNIEAAS